MSNPQKTRSDLKNTVTLLYVFGFFILLMQLYYTNYHLLRVLSLNWEWLDVNALSKPQWKVFDDIIQIRSIVILFFGSILLFPTSKPTDKNLLLQLGKLSAAVAIFFGVQFLLLLPYPNYVGQILTILISIGSATAIVRMLFYFARYFNKSQNSLDMNRKFADGFPQMQELVDTKYSINLRYTYREGLIEKFGWINVVNPFRATTVIGKPGSGKTYSTLEEYMRQLIMKDFCAVIYDYKDPTLSTLAYNYLQLYKETFPNKKAAEFVYISFKDLKRTNRCNPLKNITSSAEALDFATVVLTALNRKFEEKKGDFFTESAKNYTALVIYMLGLVKNGRYQSLPHLLQLVGRKSEASFPVIRLIAIFYPDMKSLFGPFEQAFDNDVLEQLSGQLASAQIGLGSMADKELAFVMTEDPNDFSIGLHVNSLEQPQIVCIGNNPVKDIVYGLADSVYLSRLAKTCNTKGTPCLFAVDELPTVYIKGLDNLIATGRSNLIAVLLGFQDYAQMVRDYGRNIAEALIQTVANIFSGSVTGDTAKKLSESIGDKRVKKIGETHSHDGTVSANVSEVKERRVTQDTIEELSQGEFVGRVCDDRANPFDKKVFHGTIQVDPKHKSDKHTIPILRDISDEDLDAKCQQNLVDISTDITKLLKEIQQIANAYIILQSMTIRDDKNRPNYHLLDYIENPEDPATHKNLFIWLEQAYIIINDVQRLELKNDSLSFETKVDLLMLDIYEGSIEDELLLRESRKKLNVMDILSVKEAIKNFNEGKRTIPANYNSFEDANRDF